MICGFLAFDAPARVRVRWQLLCAPVVGLCAALGVLSSAGAVLAVAAMAVVATSCGYLVAVSLRMTIAGLTFTLALLIAQGLFLDASEAARALALGALRRRWSRRRPPRSRGSSWDREREEFRFGPAFRERSRRCAPA